MEVWKILESSTKKKLVYLFVAGLLFWISITLLLPTLPLYIQYVGGTTKQVGIVMGSFAIGLLASRGWLGRVADRRSRKLVILIGSFVAVIAPIFYMSADSVYSLAATRAFHGISIAAFTIGYSALVVDLSPVEYRGTLIGYMNLAVPIGMSIGPALGGFLQANGKQYVPEGTGYEPLFTLSAICAIFTLILSSQIGATTLPNAHSATDRHQIARSFKEFIRDRALLVPATVLLSIGLVFGTLVAFLPLFIRELGLDFNIGVFYTVVAMTSFSVRLFVGKASDRYGRGLFLSAALVCYIISMLLLTIAQTPIMFILAAISEGAGAGVLIPLTLALVSDRSYANERGKVFAFCMGGFDVGIALGGPCFGFLEPILGGYRGVFALAAVLAAISLFIFMTQSGKNTEHSVNFALGRAPDVYALNK